MEREDHDARELPQSIILAGGQHNLESAEGASDSEMSCLSVAGSPRARRLKLDKLVYGMTSNEMVHLRGVKLKAQKRLHNVRQRKGGEKNRHLPDLIDDISSVLSWQTHQTRDTDGKFGQSDTH